MYLSATAEAFDADLDYAMVVKKFKAQPKPENVNYSPEPVQVRHDQEGQRLHPTGPTSPLVLRGAAELTIRMSMRRFTRLANAFSKKLENLTAAVSLHFMFYNFARPHMTLTKRYGKPTTPAMAAGKADHVWSLIEIAGLLDSNAGSN